MCSRSSRYDAPKRWRRAAPVIVGLAMVVWAGPAAGPAAADGGHAVTGAFAAAEPGGRATALGGALGPLVTDASAVYWSPARLLNVEAPGATIAYADLYGLGLVHQTALYLAWPVRARALDWAGGEVRSELGEPHHGWGLGVQSTRVDLEPQSYGEYDVSLAYARRGALGLSWAFAAHVLVIDSDLIDVGGNGYALDFALARPLGSALDASLVVRSLLSSVNWDASDSETLTPRAHLGLCWAPTAGLAVPVEAVWDLELDSVVQIAGGAEWWPLGEALALRAGLRWRDDGQETEVFPAGGVGLQWMRIAFDYGLAIGREELGDTHRLGLGVQF